MLISFFEEFPSKKNLSKLKYINWPTKLYLSAKSLKEFNKLKSNIKNKNIKEFVYWPILDGKEGYWISPFSKRKALKRIFSEFDKKNKEKNKKIPIMIDAELPTRHNPLLYLSQCFKFFMNRKLIRDFVKKHPDVYSAEYYPQGRFNEKLLEFFGLHFNPNVYGNKVIKMVYHSLHDFDKEFIIDELKSGKKEFGDDYLVAFGTIYTGIQHTEPLLPVKQLEEDLNIAKKLGIKEIVIFRLGGLNDEYAKLLKKFTS